MMIDYEHMLRNLLAMVHGDGGHYVEKVGIEDATKHAEYMVAYMRGEIKGYTPISSEEHNKLLDDHTCSLGMDCTLANPRCVEHFSKYDLMKRAHSHIEGEDYSDHM